MSNFCRKRIAAGTELGTRIFPAGDDTAGGIIQVRAKDTVVLVTHAVVQLVVASAGLEHGHVRQQRRDADAAADQHVPGGLRRV